MARCMKSINVASSSFLWRKNSRSRGSGSAHAQAWRRGMAASVSIIKAAWRYMAHLGKAAASKHHRIKQ